MATLTLNVRPDGAVRGAKRAEDALDRTASAGRRAERQLDNTSSSAANMGRRFGLAATAVLGVATAFGVKSVNAYRAQNRALTEVLTLVDGTKEEFDALNDASQRFAATYGGSATQQVTAFYQAISAGVGDVTDATVFLDQANQLALAGVTDVTTAVDLLTTATNAYAATNLEAGQASDILFATVRAGKTTIAELSSSLGNVAPLAAAAGVGLEEIAAATATLTLQGQSTSVAMNGVRQAISSILKPSGEAQKLAADLKVEFNAAALASKGLAGFLSDVTQATGGSQEQLAKLFGSVEALNAVLGLSVQDGEVFQEVLEGIGDSAGVTAKAADLVADSLETRFAKQLAAVGNVALQAGQVLLSVLVPALDVVGQAFTFLAGNSEVLGVALAGLVATQIPSAVAALTTLTAGFISSATAAGGMAAAIGVLRGALALLGGPIGLLIGGATAAAAALILLRDKTDDVKDSAYNAALGEVTLYNAMDKLSSDYAPQSIADAKNLANERLRQARNTLSAAEAEVALAEASLRSDLSTGANLPAPALSSFRDDEIENRQQEIKDYYEGQVLTARAAVDAARQAIKDIELETATGDQFRGEGGPTSPPTLTNLITTSQDELRRILADVETGAASGEDAVNRIKAALEGLDPPLADVRTAAQEVGDTFGETFAKVITGAQSARDAIRGLLLELANSNLQRGLSGIFSGLFPNFGKSGISTVLGSILGAADGAAIDRGGVIPFASGGIVTGPTLFPMANRTGLMGEAGPEAILPLKRGPGGDLGVTATGAGPVVNVSLAVDARGATRDGAAEFERAAARLLPELEARAVAAVKQAQRRGY